MGYRPKKTLAWIPAISALISLLPGIGLSQAPDRASLRVRKGFQVERIYAVPRDTQGSWVALAVDPQGRLIASDQAGGLYRIELNAARPPTVERIDLPIGHAHGLLFAFDSLYAVVAEQAHHGPGLYRLRDTDADDRFDQAQLLQTLEGTGEHGPHSLVLAPDGRSLLLVAGNKTTIPAAALSDSRVPTHWGEDDLLPRLWGPIGSEAGTPAPGGWIAQLDPEAQHWQLLAVGLRNAFDLALHPNGDLFTVDADAEFDLGTPWYQPTRVFHVIPGTDFGWRSGAGKWPPHYPDTLPPVVELGPGSPTGITFTHATGWPTPYDNALLVGDWSHGRIVAVHLQPHGGSYRGEAEEIVTGTPLPITDLVVHPLDRSVYFTLGGRGTTSGLYRLWWQGDEAVPLSDDPRPANSSDLQPREPSRSTSTESGPTVNEQQESQVAVRELLSIDRDADPGRALDRVWPRLAHADRAVRHTARIVLEYLPHRQWSQRALEEPNATARLTALLALTRSNDADLLPAIVDALVQLDWATLDRDQQQTLLRCFELAFLRMAPGGAAPAIRDAATEYLLKQFPQGVHALDVELCRLLVYLESPRVPELAVPLLAQAITPQQRLALAMPLRLQARGWTEELRGAYFAQLSAFMEYRGGLSLVKYLESIAADALSRVPLERREHFAQLLDSTPRSSPAVVTPRPIVREWTLAELSHLDAESVADGDRAAGRQLFADVQCFACHRFDGEGGAVGPDLTTVARRLTTRDLLEAIIEPSSVVSDQFAATTVMTRNGRILTGRVVNLQRDALLLQTDMLDPGKLQRVATQDIEQMQPAATSMMPGGLINSLTFEEIVDLLAFLHSHSQ